MKRSIRRTAFLVVLLPTLVPALALSVWFTASRVRDAQSELQARGEREAAYLAGAAELALLVGDDAALSRLAGSTIRAPGAARVVFFLDAAGAVLASAGSPQELGLALNCWRASADCSGTDHRRLFGREVRSRAEADADPPFGSDAPHLSRDTGTALGTVVLSFDPEELATLQWALLVNAIVSTAVALLAASFIAGLAATRLSGPMQQLLAVVSRIRGGDLSARTEPRGTGELRELEDGVNAMADQVESASADLNRKIDEATAVIALSNLELERRNRELDTALAGSEAANRAKDLFLARMSHELRTPLSTVVGYARLMQQSQSPTQREEFYRPIAQASGILQRTVDDILDLVRLESGAVSLERRPFDLAACIEDAALMYAPAAHRKGLVILSHLDRQLPPRVRGDAIRLSQVLANLLSNAVKFTEQGGIEVLTEVLSHEDACVRVRIEVSDTGTGIAPEGVSQLFQPFAQADESITRRFGGSGLGLSISARIVEALKGSIRLDSRLGEGTRAVVELPFETLESPGVMSSIVGLNVRVLADAASPHVWVLQDYLQAAGCRVELRPWSITGMPAPDLSICIEDQPLLRWQPPPGPVLRLLPVEQTGALPPDELAGCLPLPLRRADLLAACERLSGRSRSLATGESEPVAPRERLTPRCLLVEDNALNLRMLATGLSDIGVSVLEAADGHEALQLLQSCSVDLVLLDVHMPGMDGVSLAREIRRGDPVLPLYALTANVVGSEEAALREAGVAEILYKPVDEERLRALLLRHHEQAECELLQPPGIESAEILDELQRLERAITRSLAAGAPDQAREFAHQLLGAARLFTRGELMPRCLLLELAARDGDISAAFAALGALRHALHGLFMLQALGRVSSAQTMS